MHGPMNVKSVHPHSLSRANTQLAFHLHSLDSAELSVCVFKQKLENGFVEAALKFSDLFFFLTSIRCPTMAEL